MVKKYSSFSEIDERLEILKLQKEIYKESFKLDLNKAKTGFDPTQLLTGIRGSVQETLLTFAIKKLKGLFK